MPVTKQVIKRVKQAKKRYMRNRHYSSQMKSMIKLILGYIKKSESDKALAVLPRVTKAIDMAAKKNLIHKNNAARKKSSVQRAVNGLSSKKAAPKKEVAEKKEAPKKAADKK